MSLLTQIADVWSCGVTLYVMLVGTYPFGDSRESKDFRDAIERILNVQYSFPDHVNISGECRDLISRILVRDPAQVSEYSKTTIFCLHNISLTGNVSHLVTSALKWQILESTRGF